MSCPLRFFSWLFCLFSAIAIVSTFILVIQRQQPAKSPWIAYYTEDSGVSVIYRMRPDGSQIRQLTDLAHYSFLPTWSSDGHQIYYMLDPDGNSYDLNTQVYRMDVNGKHHEYVSDLGSSIFIADNIQYSDLSPDGQWRLFMSDRNGNTDVYRIRTDGSQLEQLTIDVGFDASPSWSPPIDLSWQPEALLFSIFIMLALTICMLRFSRITSRGVLSQ